MLAQLSLAFQGSKDCNPRSATPSDVRGNRRIIITLADHGDTALRLFFSGMDRSVRDRCPARPGASLASLPAPGTYLRAEYSIVKVQAVLLRQGKVVRNTLYDLLVRLGNFAHDPIQEITLYRGESRILWPVSIYETDTAIVSSPCGLNGVCK